MEYDEMFTVLSMCFAPVGQDEWKQLVDGPLWSDFLDAARRGLQDDDALGEPTSPIARVRSRCPLQEFLSAGEVKALFTPPTYDEKRLFAARHFTGGLPESAVPAESLYTTWSNGPLPSPFSKAEGMYQGDSARYMRDLVERMGMRVPPEFSSGLRSPYRRNCRAAERVSQAPVGGKNEGSGSAGVPLSDPLFQNVFVGQFP